MTVVQSCSAPVPQGFSVRRRSSKGLQVITYFLWRNSIGIEVLTQLCTEDESLSFRSKMNAVKKRPEEQNKLRCVEVRWFCISELVQGADERCVTQNVVAPLKQWVLDTVGTPKLKRRGFTTRERVP